MNVQVPSSVVRRRSAERVVCRGRYLLACGKPLYLSYLGHHGLEAYVLALAALTVHAHPHGQDQLEETFFEMRRIAMLTGLTVMSVVCHDRCVRVSKRTTLAEFMDAARLKQLHEDYPRAEVEILRDRIDDLIRLENAYRTRVYDYVPRLRLPVVREIHLMIKIARKHGCRVRMTFASIPIEVHRQSRLLETYRLFKAEHDRRYDAHALATCG